jgi:hypothetical protein
MHHCFYQSAGLRRALHRIDQSVEWLLMVTSEREAGWYLRWKQVDIRIHRGSYVMQKLKNSLAAIFVLCPVISATGLILAQTGTPALAQAADPARLAAARDLMQAERAEELYGKLLPGAWDAGGEFVSQTLGQVEDPALREWLRKQTADSEKAMQQARMKQRGELLDIVAAAYARSFTVEEMHAIAAFHRSPLGEKLIKITLDVKDMEIVKRMMTGKPIVRPATVDPVKLKAVKEMMDASGITPNTFGSLFVAAVPDWPESQRAEMMSHIYDLNIAKMAHELTQEEVAGITSFYQSPYGSKLAKTMPPTVAEVAKATKEKLGGPGPQTPSLPGK